MSVGREILASKNTYKKTAHTGWRFLGWASDSDIYWICYFLAAGLRGFYGRLSDCVSYCSVKFLASSWVKIVGLEYLRFDCVTRNWMSQYSLFAHQIDLAIFKKLGLPIDEICRWIRFCSKESLGS